MNTKKVLFIAILIALTSFTQKTFAQDWKVWFTENKVEFLSRFVPDNGSKDAYFHLKVVNRSGEYKSIYFYPVYVYDNKITGTSEKRNFYLKPGATYEEKFYITQQAIIQAGNNIPDITFKEYSVKKY
ncbi:MAG: hypothetical protein DRI95_15205 [Bacteroidetes bacterium]|nr:MAG: hypothetical protein DRI95_15205 [Bacteroidota bacterium]